MKSKKIKTKQVKNLNWSLYSDNYVAGTACNGRIVLASKAAANL